MHRVSHANTVSHFLYLSSNPSHPLIHIQSRFSFVISSTLGDISLTIVPSDYGLDRARQPPATRDQKRRAGDNNFVTGHYLPQLTPGHIYHESWSMVHGIKQATPDLYHINYQFWDTHATAGTVTCHGFDVMVDGILDVLFKSITGSSLPCIRFSTPYLLILFTLDRGKPPLHIPV